MRSLVLLAIVAVLPCLCSAQASSSKIDALFYPMLSGKRAYPNYCRVEASVSNLGFPKELTWTDIPTLLARSTSRRQLHAFLYNPISSLSQSHCTEGMMAMWLVEGLRKGDHFASLNPLCLNDKGLHNEVVSEQHHAIVAKAYAAWWTKVKNLPRDKAMATDPLRLTGLTWYGSINP